MSKSSIGKQDYGDSQLGDGFCNSSSALMRRIEESPARHSRTPRRTRTTRRRFRESEGGQTGNRSYSLRSRRCAVRETSGGHRLCGCGADAADARGFPISSRSRFAIQNTARSHFPALPGWSPEHRLSSPWKRSCSSAPAPIGQTSTTGWKTVSMTVTDRNHANWSSSRSRQWQINPS